MSCCDFYLRIKSWSIDTLKNIFSFLFCVSFFAFLFTSIFLNPFRVIKFIVYNSFPFTIRSILSVVIRLFPFIAFIQHSFYLLFICSIAVVWFELLCSTHFFISHSSFDFIFINNMYINVTVKSQWIATNYGKISRLVCLCDRFTHLFIHEWINDCLRMKFLRNACVNTTSI